MRYATILFIVFFIAALSQSYDRYNQTLNDPRSISLLNNLSMIKELMPVSFLLNDNNNENYSFRNQSSSDPNEAISNSDPDDGNDFTDSIYGADNLTQWNNKNELQNHHKKNHNQEGMKPNTKLNKYQRIIKKVYDVTLGTRMMILENERNKNINKNHFFVSSAFEPIDNIWGDRPWHFEQISDEDLHENFLEEEIISGMRSSINSSENCPNRSYCCISTYSRGGEPEYLEDLDPVNDSARKMNLWTKFIPQDRDEAQGFADALNLMFTNVKERRDVTYDNPPHILFFGDSIMEQTYHFLLCQLERSMGVQVIKETSRDLFNNEEDYKIPVHMWNEMPLEYYRTEIQLITISEGIQPMIVSFVKQHRTFVDPITMKNTHIPLLATCGLPTNVSLNGTYKILDNKKMVDVLVINHGVHYLSVDEYKFQMESLLEVLARCQANGVQVIFRDTLPQHFANSYGGEYTKGNQNEIPIREPRPLEIENARHKACDFLIFQNAINNAHWRYQKLKEAADAAGIQFNIIPIKNITVCSNLPKNGFQLQNRIISYLPLYPIFAPLYNSHLNKDCTHYRKFRFLYN